MGSSLVTLRSLLANQIDYTGVSSTSNPSTVYLDDLINRAIRKIARRDKPQELMTYTPETANMTSGVNYVAMPSNILIPYHVYIKDSGGKYKELRQLPLSQIISMNGSRSYFDSNNSGDPYYYAVANGKLVFDKYFPRTEAGAIYVMGLKNLASLTGTNLVTNGDNEAAVMTVDANTAVTLVQFLTGNAPEGNYVAYYLSSSSTNSIKWNLPTDSVAYSYSMYIRYLSAGTFTVSNKSGTLHSIVATSDYSIYQGSFTASTSDYIQLSSSVNVGGAYVDGVEIYQGSFTTDLNSDWDMLITYEAAAMFYQRDDDSENVQKFMQLASQERAELMLSMETDYTSFVELDRRTFGRAGYNISNPNIFFGP